jgi:hypothetical protein
MLLAAIAGPRSARCQDALLLAAPLLAARKAHSPDIAAEDLLWLILKLLAIADMRLLAPPQSALFPRPLDNECPSAAMRFVALIPRLLA